jgi:uncharacterized protein YqkB
MNEVEKLITNKLNEKNWSGIFFKDAFDLDVNENNNFILWLDENSFLIIPLLDVNENNAKKIQQIVEKCGRSLCHTWDMQYSDEI